MRQYDLQIIEQELRKRFSMPYQWGRKQNDVWDKQSAFIYKTLTWESLLQKCEEASKDNSFEKKEFIPYAANRWYNFWSAMAVEQIFTSIPGVIPALNSRDRLRDFNLYGINFDHKTSVFPRGFQRGIHYARLHRNELIDWLYKNQSVQQRQHYDNRLFLIVYAEDGAHWKLKAEIPLLKRAIEAYVATFDVSQLYKTNFQPGKDTFSDVIWIKR